MEFNFFTFIFLFAILTSVLALLYLNFRQDKAIDNSFDAVPDGFSETIKLEDHQKAGKYTKAGTLWSSFGLRRQGSNRQLIQNTKGRYKSFCKVL